MSASFAEDFQPTVTHKATISHIRRSGTAHIVRVHFDDDRFYDTRFRKSWSQRKYVDVAMEHLHLIAAWDMRYSWSDDKAVDGQ